MIDLLSFRDQEWLNRILNSLSEIEKNTVYKEITEAVLNGHAEYLKEKRGSYLRVVKNEPGDSLPSSLIALKTNRKVRMLRTGGRK